jgi:hypothetical protein
VGASATCRLSRSSIADQPLLAMGRASSWGVSGAAMTHQIDRMSRRAACIQRGRPISLSTPMPGRIVETPQSPHSSLEVAHGVPPFRRLFLPRARSVRRS